VARQGSPQAAGGALSASPEQQISAGKLLEVQSLQPPIGLSVTNGSGEDRNQEDDKFSSIKFQNVIFFGQSECANSINPSNKMCDDKHRSGAQNKQHEQSACESSSTYNSSTSDIFQCDGADSISSTSSILSEDTEYNTEDEALTERESAVLVPAPKQLVLVLEVDETGMMVLPASLPLIMLTNARSLYNKIDSFTEWFL
jgi:hypothetical protein